MLVVHMCIMIKYKIENNMFVYMATLIIYYFFEFVVKTYTPFVKEENMLT